MVVDHQNSSNSKTERYTYQDNELLNIYDEYNDRLATFTHSTLKTDDALAVSITDAGKDKGMAPQAQSYFFIKDGLGSITDIVDGSGNKVQHHVYSSFGKLLKITDKDGNSITAPIVAIVFSYTGREHDKESGLYYYRARYYSPEIGRFLQSDPDSGVKQQPLTFVSKHIYVMNNPINMTDPMGLWGSDFKRGYDNIRGESSKAWANREKIIVTATLIAVTAYLAPEIAIAAGIITLYQNDWHYNSDNLDGFNQNYAMNSLSAYISGGIAPKFTFGATAKALVWTGAIPVAEKWVYDWAGPENKSDARHAIWTVKLLMAGWWLSQGAPVDGKATIK